jgi:FHA domain
VKTLIKRDMANLKAEGQDFLPGRIFFISGGAPTDDWESDYEKLVDCDVEIFTWGTGDAGEARLEEIAGKHGREFSKSTFSPAALLGEYMRIISSTDSDPNITHSIVVQAAHETHVFHTDFTAGRQGQLAVTDDDNASSHHVRFQFAHGSWYVEDLNSTNGTWLNGRRIFAAQRLKKADKIRIGRTTIQVISV